MGACSNRPAVAVEAKVAAATLLIKMGQLHMQQHSQEVDMPAAPLQPAAALQCFREAASKVHGFGETPWHVMTALGSLCTTLWIGIGAVQNFAQPSELALRQCKTAAMQRQGMQMDFWAVLHLPCFCLRCS